VIGEEMVDDIVPQKCVKESSTKGGLTSEAGKQRKGGSFRTSLRDTFRKKLQSMYEPAKVAKV